MRGMFIILAIMVCGVAQATVDGQGEASIVIQNYHSGEYMLQTVPTDYCVGIDVASLAMAITQPVTIKSNYGCGSKPVDTQINELVCAKISATDEYKNLTDKKYEHYQVDADIELDLTECKEKANPAFVSAALKAIRVSFNKSSYQIKDIKIIK